MIVNAKLTIDNVISSSIIMKWNDRVTNNNDRRMCTAYELNTITHLGAQTNLKSKLIKYRTKWPLNDHKWWRFCVVIWLAIFDCVGILNRIYYSKYVCRLIWCSRLNIYQHAKYCTLNAPTPKPNHHWLIHRITHLVFDHNVSFHIFLTNE